LALFEASARISSRGYRFDPRESIPIQEALRIQTMGSAYAGFQEKEIGSIEEGKAADLAVWDRDFYAIPADQIKGAKAETTISKGKIIFNSS
jgi:predicted amidohydrolase YtcJ